MNAHNVAFSGIRFPIALFNVRYIDSHVANASDSHLQYSDTCITSTLACTTSLLGFAAAHPVP
eukprot:5747932-Pyramimonas_sp.AAC.1